MALLGDLLEDSLPGVVVGAVAAAVLLPILGVRRMAAASNGGGGNGQGVARPILKAAVRGYLNVADKVKEVTAEAREQMSDLVAEIREENRLREDETSAPTETAKT
jgi:hypothetical protein